MNTTITLSKKGIKELKRNILTLEKELSTTRDKLRNMEKDTSHEGRLERIEALAIMVSTEQELSEKRATLKSAKLLPRKINSMKISIGSVVELIDKQGRRLKFTLVESIEANPLDGRISIKSPLGIGLIGKTIRDTIEFTTRKGHQQMRVVAIS